MPYEEIYLEAEEQMGQSVERFRQTIRTVRTSRATPSLVEHIKVDYYGTPTPLRQLSAISVQPPNLLVIRPYDPSSLGDIEKAILKADIGLTPNNDGKLIRITVPPLSEERRRKLIAHIKDLAEQAKRAIRATRQQALKTAEKEKKDGIIPEDDFFRLKDDIQELTKDHEGKVDELLQQKSSEILEE